MRNCAQSNRLIMLDINQIKQKKASGDYLVVSKILNLSTDIVRASFNRAYSKNHNAVLDALSKVITARENLINNS